VLDGFDRDVDVKVRPIKMPRARTLHIENGAHRCALEPWELLEAEEVLAVVDQEPETLGRDAEDFNV
jgi:hypothetical protein